MGKLDSVWPGLSLVLSGCLINGGCHLPGPAEYYIEYDFAVATTRPDIESTGYVSPVVGNPYIGDDIEVAWRLSNFQIVMEIRNKGSDPLTILWAKSSIILDVEPEPLVASIGYPRSKDVQQRLNKSGLPQAESVLDPSGTGDFIVFPLSQSRWQQFTDSEDGFWTAAESLWGIDPEKQQTRAQIQAAADSAIGKTVIVHLAIKRHGSFSLISTKLSVTAAKIKRVNW